MKETQSNEYWFQKLLWSNTYDKNGFFSCRPGKISPSKISITLLTDME